MVVLSSWWTWFKLECSRLISIDNETLHKCSVVRLVSVYDAASLLLHCNLHIVQQTRVVCVPVCS